MTTVVQRGTRPDPAWLWKLLVVLRHNASGFGIDVDEYATPKWRIAYGDAESLRDQLGGEYAPSATPGQPDSLFGIPVEVVADAPYRWPELVLVCDRRIATGGAA